MLGESDRAREPKPRRSPASARTQVHFELAELLGSTRFCAPAGPARHAAWTLTHALFRTSCSSGVKLLFHALGFSSISCGTSRKG